MLIKCLVFAISITLIPFVYAGKLTDKHYSHVGFFDIHYCNWPDRKPFILALFSTVHYKNINEIEIFDPDNRKITSLDLDRFRQVETKSKKIKKVFIKQVEVDATFKDGWYRSVVSLNDGTKVISYDYVKYTLMEMASKTVPEDESEEVDVPESLRWKKIDDAKYYQVFIKDMWQDGKLIYTSKLLDKNKLKLPEGLLEPGGYYSWRIHARDVNEDIKLGDFNHGSLSKILTFSVTD